MANGLNGYLHGSVWSWIPGENALIISNDEHNIQNPELICLTVSGVKGGASVCVDDKNYIQCNQIQMLEKNALSKFEGAVPAPVLTAAKAKISALLNIVIEPGNLQPIRDTAAKLVGQLAQMDAGYASPIAEPAVADAPSVQIADDTDKNDDKPEVILPDNQQPAPKPKKTTNPRVKKNKTKPITEKETGNSRRESKSYSEEDEAFVLDGNHSTEEIMKRFNFAEKKQAYAAKNYLRARRIKQQNKNS